MTSRYCKECGKQYPEGAKYCPNCGVHIRHTGKSRVVAILLCFFLGCFGIHRFYVGKIGTGILWFLTFGLFGIGTIIDFVMIVCGVFTDSKGHYVREW